MPQALAGVDWEEVKAMFLSGLNPRQISEKMGLSHEAIRQRVRRGNWTGYRDKAKEIAVLTEDSSSEGAEQSPLDSASERVRRGLASDLKRSVDLIAASPPQTLKAALRRHRELVPLVANAKTVFGWSDSTTQPLVRIAILSASGLTNALPQGNDTAGYVPDSTQAQPVIDLVPVQDKGLEGTAPKASFSQAQEGQSEGGQPL